MKQATRSSIVILPALAAALLAPAGCGKRAPDERRTAGPSTMPLQPGETRPGSLPAPPHLDENASVAMRLDMIYRLDAGFAEAFQDSVDEVCAFIRKHAFVEGDPGDAVRLGLDPGKRLLSAHFEGPASIQNQARLSGWLRRGGWWKMPGEKTPAVVQRVDPATEKAREKALSYQHALLQLGNDAARQAALDEMAAGLAGSDPVAKLAALNAISSAAEIDFDRAKFRGLLLPLLEDPSGNVRGAALGSLLICNPAREDLERVLAMQDDPAPEVRRALPFAIQRLAKGELTGAAAGVISKLLDQVEPNDRRSFLSSLWGSKYSPELEEKLVNLATPFNGREAYDVMYYSLSTQQNKGEKTVNLLIDCLSNPDQGNVGGRALWGLGYGVNPEQQPKVADAALDFFTVRSRQRDDCLRILSQYGQESHAQRLGALLEKPGLPAELRKQMQSTVASIRSRSRAQ